MSVRDDAIEVAIAAIRQMDLDAVRVSSVTAVVVDAVTPIIRIDEQKRLRDKVKALPVPLWWNDGEDALVFRSQVLALLGGNDE